jgi:hypothetical protein
MRKKEYEDGGRPRQFDELLEESGRKRDRRNVFPA